MESAAVREGLPCAWAKDSSFWVFEGCGQRGLLLWPPDVWEWKGDVPLCCLKQWAVFRDQAVVCRADSQGE